MFVREVYVEKVKLILIIIIANKGVKNVSLGIVKK